MPRSSTASRGFTRLPSRDKGLEQSKRGRPKHVHRILEVVWKSTNSIQIRSYMFDVWLLFKVGLNGASKLRDPASGITEALRSRRK